VCIDCAAGNFSKLGSPSCAISCPTGHYWVPNTASCYAAPVSPPNTVRVGIYERWARSLINDDTWEKGSGNLYALLALETALSTNPPSPDLTKVLSDELESPYARSEVIREGTTWDPALVYNNYGARLRGYFKAPVTGLYTFWLCSDDNGQLKIDGNLIASEDSWNNWDIWGAAEHSTQLSLEENAFYYLEGLMVQGGGGDHIQIGVTLPGFTSASTVSITSYIYQLSPCDTNQEWNGAKCQSCVAGRYFEASTLSCTPCGRGKYLVAITGGTKCENCAAGFSTKTTGVSDAGGCEACAAGTYGVGGEACEQCAKGKASSSLKATTSGACVSCALGQYSGDGAATCTACAAGKKLASATMGQEETACTSCASGEYSAVSAVSCTSCSAGTYASSPPSAVCTECATGAYSGASSPSCTECAAGKWLAHSATSFKGTACTDCPDGSFSGSGVTSCTLCSAGKKLANQETLDESLACTACENATYSGEGATSCTACEKGKNLVNAATPNEWTACSDCLSGEYSGGEDECRPCPAGKSVVNTGVSDPDDACKSCSSGQYSGDGVTSCTPCSAGKKLAKKETSDESDACSACESATFSGEGATSCTSCISGKYLTNAATSSESSACSICDAGKYSDVPVSGSCTPCEAGKFLTDAATSAASHDTSTDCESCASGQYCGGGAATCTACSAGKKLASATTGVEETACTSCAIGKRSEDPAVSCTSCSAGTYASSPPSAVCTKCAPGAYSGASSPSCTECAAGKHAPTSASVKCTDCGSGHFTNAPGLANCTACSPGSVRPVGCLEYSSPYIYEDCNCSSSCLSCDKDILDETDDCVTCDNGLPSSPSNGWPFTTGKCPSSSTPQGCFQCPAGRFSNGVFCENCNQGTYNENKGSFSGSDCLGCPLGKYNDDFGSSSSSSCKDCDAGKYAFDTVAAKGCKSCEDGKNSSAQGSADSATCVSCAAATWSAPDHSVCKPCPGGFACDGSSKKKCSQHFYADASSSCTLCAEGKYTNKDGSSSCEICPEGSSCCFFTTSQVKDGGWEYECGDYSKTPGDFVDILADPSYSYNLPVRCMPGRYTSDNNKRVDPIPNVDTGARCAESCPRGEYHDYKQDDKLNRTAQHGDDICEPCPAGTFCPDEWKDSLSQEWPFKCRQNRYCPLGTFDPAQCSPGTEVPESVIGESIDNCTQCVKGKRTEFPGDPCTFCPAGTQGPSDPSSVFDKCYECPNADSCLADNECASGYAGSLCGACAPEHYQVGNKCHECSANLWPTLLAGGLVLLVFACLSRVELSLHHIIRLKIYSTFAQLLTLIMYVDVDWPPLAEKFMSFLMFFSFNIEVAHPDCISPMSFYFKYSIVIVTPATVLLGLLCGDQWCRRREAHYRSAGHHNAVKAHAYRKRFRMIRQVGVIFITAIYSPVLYYCFKMFSCMESEGSYVMAADTNIKCEGDFYLVMCTLAGTVTAVVGVGVPAGIYLLIRKIKTKLNTGTILLRWGALYEWYRDECAWFESAALARKLLMLVGLAWLKEGGQQVLVLVTVNAAYAVVIYKYKPFILFPMRLSIVNVNVDFYNFLELATAVASCFDLMLGGMTLGDTTKDAADAIGIVFVAANGLLVAVAIGSFEFGLSAAHKKNKEKEIKQEKDRLSTASRASTMAPQMATLDNIVDALARPGSPGFSHVSFAETREPGREPPSLGTSREMASMEASTPFPKLSSFKLFTVHADHHLRELAHRWYDETLAMRESKGGARYGDAHAIKSALEKTRLVLVDELNSFEDEVKERLEEFRGDNSLGSIKEGTIGGFLSGMGEKKLLDELVTLVDLIEIWPRSREQMLEVKLKNMVGVYQEWHKGYRARLKNFLAVEESELKEEDEKHDMEDIGKESFGGSKSFSASTNRGSMPGVIPKPPRGLMARQGQGMGKVPLKPTAAPPPPPGGGVEMTDLKKLTAPLKPTAAPPPLPGGGVEMTDLKKLTASFAERRNIMAKPAIFNGIRAMSMKSFKGLKSMLTVKHERHLSANIAGELRLFKKESNRVLSDAQQHVTKLIVLCLKTNDFLIARKADELLEMVILQHEHDMDCVAYGLDPSKQGRKKITEKVRDQMQRLWLPR